MSQTTSGILEEPDHLAKAKNCLKELKEALEVCKKVEDQLAWACDFSSFPSINNALEPVLESLNEAWHQIEQEADYVDNQIEDYYLKLYEFDQENAIEL
jgi:hypothetical protein